MVILWGAGGLWVVAKAHEGLVSEGAVTADPYPLPPLLWPSLWAVVAVLVLRDLVLHTGRLEVYTGRLVHRRFFGLWSRTVRLDGPCRLREWLPWWTTAWRMQITGTPDRITVTSHLKKYWHLKSELKAMCPELSTPT